MAQTLQDYNPHSHWSCDETTSIRYDSATTSNDLTDNNSTGYTSGLLDNACDFDSASSQWLSISDASQTGLESGDFSVSAWVRPESFSSEQSIASKWANSASGNDFLINIRTNGQVYLQYYDGSGQDRTRSNSTLSSTSTWVHVVATVDVSTDDIQFYFDGSSTGVTTESDTNPTSRQNTNTDFRLGQRGGINHANAVVDEVTYFQRVLSTGDITDIYNSGTPLPWVIDDSGSTTIPFLIPYNQDMPKLETVVCDTATCTLNYATSTEVYLTPSNIFIILISFLLIGLLFGFLAFKFL